MGDFLIPFRTYGNYEIRENMALTVLRGVIEIKDCQYKEALFVDEVKEYLNLSKRITQEKAIDFFENDENFLF